MAKTKPKREGVKVNLPLEAYADWRSAGFTTGTAHTPLAMACLAAFMTLDREDACYITRLCRNVHDPYEEDATWDQVLRWCEEQSVPRQAARVLEPLKPQAEQSAKTKKSPKSSRGR